MNDGSHERPMIFDARLARAAVDQAHNGNGALRIGDHDAVLFVHGVHRRKPCNRIQTQEPEISVHARACPAYGSSTVPCAPCAPWQLWAFPVSESQTKKSIENPAPVPYREITSSGNRPFYSLPG